MTIKILVGGPEYNYPDNIFASNSQDRWIGVDEGALKLIDRSIIPIAIIGDFDSISSIDRKRAFNLLEPHQITYVKAEKDQTDTELALKFATGIVDDEEDIYLFGATGGRLDHELSNILAIARPELAEIIEKLRIIDKNNQIYFYSSGDHFIEKKPEYKYLGFMNITPIKQFIIKEAKYKLAKFSSQKPVMFTSNEFEGNNIAFSHDSGILAVIYAKD